MDKQLTPLMKAARKGAVNEVRSLLQEPIDVNEQDAHGLTALFHGVYSHNAEVVCTLLKAGASVRIHAVRGLTVLMYAVLYGDAGCLSVLCESAHPPSASPSRLRSLVNMQDTEGVTALMLACKTDSASFVRILLHHGADPNLYSFSGESALSYALMHNAVACVKELTSHGRFLDSRSKRHPFGALYSAAQLNEVAIVHVLCCQRAYLQQFVHEVACFPSRSEETLVEVALREEIPGMAEGVRSELGMVCVQQAYQCLRVLLGVAQGAKTRKAVSLSGLAECAKWCIKLGKVFTNHQLIPQLEPFWDRIELLTQRQRLAFEEDRRKFSPTAAESHDEGWNEAPNSPSEAPNSPSEAPNSPSSCESLSSASSVSNASHSTHSTHGTLMGEPKLKPTTASRLLFSFIEIYVLNHYDLKLASADSKANTTHRLKSIEALHPRLITFFTENKDYLW